jgi:hypothetical protein
MVSDTQFILYGKENAYWQGDKGSWDYKNLLLSVFASF